MKIGEKYYLREEESGKTIGIIARKGVKNDTLIQKAKRILRNLYPDQEFEILGAAGYYEMMPKSLWKLGSKGEFRVWHAEVAQVFRRKK